MNSVKCRPDQIQNGRLVAIFVCSNWQHTWKCCPSGWISPIPMNISSRFPTHALTTTLPWILWSVVRIKFKMADLLPFLFAQIDKIFENVVRPDEYLQHQWIFFSDVLHMHLLQPSHESCEVSSGSNLKWPTYCHFCFLKLTKYLKMLSVRMNISNTNEYFFPIFYTCIYYNPLMNPVKCRPDQIQNGQLIAIFVCSNWQNIWKCCPSGWISPTPMNICFR